MGLKRQGDRFLWSTWVRMKVNYSEELSYVPRLPTQ